MLSDVKGQAKSGKCDWKTVENERHFSRLLDGNKTLQVFIISKAIGEKSDTLLMEFVALTIMILVVVQTSSHT